MFSVQVKKKKPTNKHKDWLTSSQKLINLQWGWTLQRKRERFFISSENYKVS